MFGANLVEMLEQHLCTHTNVLREKDKMVKSADVNFYWLPT